MNHFNKIKINKGGAKKKKRHNQIQLSRIFNIQIHLNSDAFGLRWCIEFRIQMVTYPLVFIFLILETKLVTMKIKCYKHHQGPICPSPPLLTSSPGICILGCKMLSLPCKRSESTAITLTLRLILWRCDTKATDEGKSWRMFDKHHLKQSWGIISCAKLRNSIKGAWAKENRAKKHFKLNCKDVLH